MAPSKHKVKINVDLGEGYGNFKCGPDEELIPLIDHANVACGFHAGDPLIMQQTVRLCAAHSVAVGAHPGLPDIQGFGRREIKMTPEELTAMTRYQIGALQAFLDAEGVPLHHVKPHGVLYGMMYRDADVCRAVYAAVPKGVPVFGLAGTVQERVAREMGLGFVAELYGDVKYTADGTLVIDRKKKPWTAEETRAHVTSQVYEGAVTAVTGEKVDLPLGDYEVSLCCHSDSPGCMEIVKASRAIIDEFNAKTFS
ncbi:Lactam utilization protein lamB [Lasiodiplodia theobromae]|uniref:Lactam utilization protein lamB n=1 Tax=Lasiodiplodia theobromae TaxID=45133 RepID=UPI0015C387D7|nr:Lactam utilization protein lamB [Lasiodiplodia theobromae]KAF4544461.1 Lactam utilization protein lamB [Lasiodiplodia theobromae]